MTELVNRLVDELIDKREGGYVNHPNDPGGETIYGITVGTARRNGYSGSMRLMSKAQAKDIYKREYWFGASLNFIAMIYPKVAEELFDTGVNMGTGIAGRFLQEALNTLMEAELAEDGVIGKGTIGALTRYKERRGSQGEDVMVKLLDGLQCARYVELVRRRTANRSFIYGWIAHRIGNVGD